MSIEVDHFLLDQDSQQGPSSTIYRGSTSMGSDCQEVRRWKPWPCHFRNSCRFSVRVVSIVTHNRMFPKISAWSLLGKKVDQMRTSRSNHVWSGLGASLQQKENISIPAAGSATKRKQQEERRPIWKRVVSRFSRAKSAEIGVRGTRCTCGRIQDFW